MKIRCGRENPHTLYLQVGDEPSKDDDIFLGSTVNPMATTLLLACTTAADKAYANMQCVYEGFALAMKDEK